MALLAFLVVSTEVAATDQLTAILTDVVRTDTITWFTGLAMSRGVAGKTMLDDAATRAMVIIIDVKS